MEIRIITSEHRKDIDLPNESFPLYGKMLPSYLEGKWSYTIHRYPADEVSQMAFPDEHYDYDEMSKNCFFVGAYEEGRCVGLQRALHHGAGQQPERPQLITATPKMSLTSF